MRIDLFLNDSYKILNLLYENQTVVLDRIDHFFGNGDCLFCD